MNNQQYNWWANAGSMYTPNSQEWYNQNASFPLEIHGVQTSWSTPIRTPRSTQRRYQPYAQPSPSQTRTPTPYTPSQNEPTWEPVPFVGFDDEPIPQQENAECKWLKEQPIPFEESVGDLLKPIPKLDDLYMEKLFMDQEYKKYKSRTSEQKHHDYHEICTNLCLNALSDTYGLGFGADANLNFTNVFQHVDDYGNYSIVLPVDSLNDTLRQSLTPELLQNGSIRMNIKDNSKGVLHYRLEIAFLLTCLRIPSHPQNEAKWSTFKQFLADCIYSRAQFLTNVDENIAYQEERAARRIVPSTMDGLTKLFKSCVNALMFFAYMYDDIEDTKTIFEAIEMYKTKLNERKNGIDDFLIAAQKVNIMMTNLIDESKCFPSTPEGYREYYDRSVVYIFENELLQKVFRSIRNTYDT
jgi:hypothetical protein